MKLARFILVLMAAAVTVRMRAASLYLAAEGATVPQLRPGDSFAVWVGIGPVAGTIGVDYGFGGTLNFTVVSADLSTGPFTDANFVAVDAASDYGGTIPDVSSPVTLTGGSTLIERAILRVDSAATAGTYTLSLTDPPGLGWVDAAFVDHPFDSLQSIQVQVDSAGIIGGGTIPEPASSGLALGAFVGCALAWRRTR